MLKKFKFRKVASEKVIYIYVTGKFQIEDGISYIEEYKNVTQSINPKEYTLRFDCTNLDVTPNQSISLLESCFKMYSKSKFKKVIAILKKSQHDVLVQFNILAKKAKLKVFCVALLSFNIVKLYKPHITQFSITKLYITTVIAMFTYTILNSILDKLCRIPFFKDYDIMRT